jgi:catechol 2,3-dioxygenase-like lactoylglutathione lyase family enzyme
MEARAIDYVQYGVSSLARALPFYRDLLGMQLLGEPAGGAWQELQVGATTLALSAPPYGQPPHPDCRGGGTIAVAVADVRAAVEHLRSRGVPVLAEPFETTVCHLAAIADPDGNRVILHQRKDGTAG